MASIKDVAREANVSVATVSHVTNSTRFVSEETRGRVLAAMKKLSYSPNLVARGLRTNRTKTIALLVPDISNFFFTEIAVEIEKSLRARGYSLLLCNTNEDIEIEKQQITLLNSQLISGIILAPTTGGFNYRSLFANPNYPLVFIDRHTELLQGDTVTVEGKTATMEAVEYLIAKGHRRIGYIKGLPGLSTTAEREQGYINAMQKHDIPIDNSLIKLGNSRESSGYELCRELVEHNNITALFVANNLMTVGAFRYLSERKISVPRDVAIVGFDDYNWALITNPPLSTIAQDAGELGREAARLMLQRLEDMDGIYRQTEFVAKFKIRESC